MASEREQLDELNRTLEARRAVEAPRELQGPMLRIPPAMTADQQAEFERRVAHAQRLDREAKISYGLRNLEQQRGDRYTGCRLSNFEIYGDCKQQAAQRGVVDELQAYCGAMASNVADSRGVFLYGPCGTGKDHLAMAVARAFVLTTGSPVKWVCGAQLFQELRDSFDSDRTESRVLAPYTSAPLLWISDPLPVKGELTDYQANSLYTVIEKRYSSRRPLLVTANLEPGEADSKFGPAIARRLRETTVQLHCNWTRYGRKAVG